MKARTIAAVLAVALLGAPACGRSGKNDNGYRLRLDGRATVQAKGTSHDYDGGDHKVEVGDTVRMLDGSAVLDLPSDRQVLLRAGKADGSVVRVARSPEIVDGDAVVVAGRDGGSFSAGDVDVHLDEGAVRVQRALSVTVAVYRGRATVTTAGRELPGGLPALRQVSIAAAGQVPRAPSPLVYDDRNPDPWDRQFLGDAIDLGLDLDRRSRGLTGQLGPRIRVDAALLDRVLPSLASDPVPVDRVSASSAGEALVGASIAVEASARKALLTAWQQVFDFRAAGAKWGLVALDQQVKRDALKARLDDAAGRSPLLFAATPRQGSGRGGTGLPASGGATTGGAANGTTTTTSPPQSPQQPTPTTVPTPLGPITVPPPPTLPQQPNDDGGSSNDPGSSAPPSAVDVVTGLVDDLLNGGSSTTPTTTPLGGLVP